jgi:hypothetical protein
MTGTAMGVDWARLALAGLRNIIHAILMVRRQEKCVAAV